MLGLGERAVLPGRRDLEGESLAIVAEVPGDALADLERHPVRVIDEQAQRRSGDFRKQHLDLGLDAGEAGFDLGL